MGGLSGKVSFEHWASFRAQTRPFIYVWAITIDPQQRPLPLLLPPFTGPPPDPQPIAPPDSNYAAVAAAAEPWALRASRFPLTAAAASIHPSIHPDDEAAADPSPPQVTFYCTEHIERWLTQSRGCSSPVIYQWLSSLLI